MMSWLGRASDSGIECNQDVTRIVYLLQINSPKTTHFLIFAFSTPEDKITTGELRDISDISDFFPLGK